MKILIAKPNYDYYLPDAKAVAPDVQFAVIDGNAEVPPDLTDAEGVIWSWYPTDRLDNLIKSLPNLRWVQVQSAGVDRMITPIVRAAKGLTLTNAGSAFTVSIPEYVIAWMFASAKRVPEFLKHQAAHEWTFEPQLDLNGATVGIVGLGPIGQGVAVRAKALGMRTLGYRRRPEPMEGIDQVLSGAEGLDRLLQDSDYIVLCIALTPETERILNRDRIARMKPNAWLVNIGRGALVDQDALIEALRDHKIRGASLDVFTPEPLPADSPLWDLPNVTMTPHASHGGGEDLRSRQKEVGIDNLRRFVNNEPLTNVVDFNLGY